MSLIKKSLFFLFLFTVSLFPLIGKEDYRIENQPVAFEEALTLPVEGVLRQKDNGFVYLDVSNAFIHSVVPLLEHEGMIRPRPTASRSIGAHISVFHEKEEVVPQELGKVFSFAVKDIRSFTLHTRDGLKKLWVIAVQSPELENLREMYGCSPKLKGYDYHITLGKQMPTAPENWESITALSSLNFSDTPVDPLFVEGDFYVVENDALLATVAKVDAVAQLKLKGNGFVYLDVENAFVDTLSNLLPVEGTFNPVSTKPKKMGAHISVVYEDEMIGKEIWSLKEAGEWFQFEVKELRYIDRKTPKGKQRLWVLAVDAPALQRLRLQYGLNSKLKNHDFHITIGREQLESIDVSEKDAA